MAFALTIGFIDSSSLNAQETVPNGFPAIFGKMRGYDAELLLMSRD